MACVKGEGPASEKCSRIFVCGRKLENMSPASLLIEDYGLLIKEGIPEIELTLEVLKYRNAFPLK